MKIQKLILTCLITLVIQIYTQQLHAGENYWNYHSYICQAEIQFFLKNNVDSCLYYYNKGFSEFSFNFVHDLVNAAQIAFFSKKNYKPYIYKALQFGLKSSHLKQIPLFKNPDNEYQYIVQEIINFEKTEEYKNIRKTYLNSIDFEYLSWTYEFKLDEVTKRLTIYGNGYYQYLQKLMSDLLEKIEEKGFPGTRLLGINNTKIFSEIGKPELDWSALIIRDSTLLHGYEMEANALAGTSALLFLHHHNCAFFYLKPVLMREIEKGNLHPKEIALFNDILYLDKIYIEKFKKDGDIYCDDATGEDGLFKPVWWADGRDFGQYDCSHKKTNELRKKYCISPVEVDRKKEEYEKKYEFRLFWGCDKCL